MAFIYPVNAPVSQRFGINPAPYQPNGHYGMDFACAIGTEIRSIGDGVVRWADWNQNLGSNPWNIIPYATGSGIFVAVDHGNGYVSLYCHLSETLMNIGDRVTAGAIIGKSGTTGNSTGPHLHLELIYMPNVNGWNYGRVDPASLMSNFIPVGSITVEANQRKVGPSNLNQRSEAKTSAPVVRVVPANTIETFSGYVLGEMVDVGGVRSNIWYKDNQGYVWSGGFTEQTTAGLADHTPAPAPAANQRKVGPANLNQRSSANTSAPIVRVIEANTLETFSGYVRGENVNTGGVQSNIWYADSQGYVWSGGFTTQSTTGLADLTPAPAPTVPTPTPSKMKVVVPEGVRLRTQPSTSSSIIGVLEGGTKVNPTAYIEAESISDSKIWFALSSGYIHSSGVTDASVAGLTKQSAPTAPPVVEEPPYEFTRDFDFVEYKPANTWNMQNGNFPANPEKIVIHQFDAKALKPSIDGVISHFQTPRPDKPSSAHFAVSGTRIVQLVSLKDRAFHAGSVGNNYIGIEVDPQEDSATIESVKKLIRALNAKYNKTFTYSKHRDVPGNATECGADIHLENYKVDVVPTDPTPGGPPVVVDPVPAPTPAPALSEEDLIDDFLGYLSKRLKDEYFKQK